MATVEMSPEEAVDFIDYQQGCKRRRATADPLVTVALSPEDWRRFRQFQEELPFLMEQAQSAGKASAPPFWKRARLLVAVVGALLGCPVALALLSGAVEAARAALFG